MTSPEQEVSHNQGLTHDNSQPAKEEGRDLFEGIADPAFKDFIVKAQERFVLAADDYYYIARSFQPLVPDLYPHLHVSVRHAANRLLARLGPLSDHRVLKLISGEQVNVQGRVLLADKDNMIKAASYIFGRREIEKGEGKNCSVEQALGRTAELWAEHPNAGFFSEATEIERIRSEKARENVKPRDSLAVFKGDLQSKEQVLYLSRIPEGGIDFGEYDKEKLIQEAERIAQENINYFIDQATEKSTNAFPPLTPEMVTALRFVWFVDANDLVHFNKSEKSISVADLIKTLMHSANKVEEREQRLKIKDKDVVVSFADIFRIRVERVKMAAEMAKDRPSKVSPSQKTGHRF